MQSEKLYEVVIEKGASFRELNPSNVRIKKETSVYNPRLWGALEDPNNMSILDKGELLNILFLEGFDSSNFRKQYAVGRGEREKIRVVNFEYGGPFEAPDEDE